MIHFTLLRINGYEKVGMRRRIKDLLGVLIALYGAILAGRIRPYGLAFVVDLLTLPCVVVWGVLRGQARTIEWRLRKKDGAQVHFQTPC